MNRQIPFADLKSKYNAYKEELDKAVLDVMGSSMYIMGPEVEKLDGSYLGANVPGLELAQIKHETQGSRLFMS